MVAIWTVTLRMVFAGIVWIIFRPALHQFLDFAEKNAVARASSALVLLLSAVSGAFVTDWIGVHAIFGAFLLGMAVPRDNVWFADLAQAIELTVAAITSKAGATTFIGRLTKLTWRDFLRLGVMMNRRGMTELVVITTGLSLGIIGPNLRAIFIVITLVTTMMTGPLLDRLTLDREDLPTEPAGGARARRTPAIT